MKFPEDFYEYLKKNTLVEIKGGLERERYLKIWMVEVNDRIFARSWNKSEKSWFTEIIKTGLGQIKYGDKVVNIKGTKLSNQSDLHEIIDQRYLEKYNQKENLKYSRGITQPEYNNYTMEFYYAKIAK